MPADERAAHDVKSSALLWTQQSFNRAALVHRAIPFGHLIEREREVEDLAWVDLPVPNLLDQFWKIASHRRGTTMQMDVGKEQFLAIEIDFMRHTNIPY